MKMKHTLFQAVTAIVFFTSINCNVFAADSTNISIQDLFTPSGYMGDGEYIDNKYILFDGASSENPHSLPTCIHISYSFGPKTWSGIYWQNLPDNWGDDPGEDYSKKGFRKIIFWAKGKNGGEVVEFKSGGIKNNNKTYRDSFSANLGRVTLEATWKKYEIDLHGKDLSSVIGGFCWAVSGRYNKGKQIEFYLDDIQFVK